MVSDISNILKYLKRILAITCAFVSEYRALRWIYVLDSNTPIVQIIFGTLTGVWVYGAALQGC